MKTYPDLLDMIAQKIGTQYNFEYIKHTWALRILASFLISVNKLHHVLSSRMYLILKNITGLNSVMFYIAP